MFLVGWLGLAHLGGWLVVPLLLSGNLKKGFHHFTHPLVISPSAIRTTSPLVALSDRIENGPRTLKYDSKPLLGLPDPSVSFEWRSGLFSVPACPYCLARSF